MSRATALRLASGFFDWSAAFLLLVAVFATFDQRTGVTFAFLGAGLLSTLLARYLGSIDADV